MICCPPPPPSRSSSLRGPTTESKIGCLGFTSSLMGSSMTGVDGRFGADVDLIWLVPKVEDLEYPPGDPAYPTAIVPPNSSSTFVLKSFPPSGLSVSQQAARRLFKGTHHCVSMAFLALGLRWRSFRNCHPTTRLGGGSLETTTLKVKYASRPFGTFQCSVFITGYVRPSPQWHHPRWVNRDGGDGNNQKPHPEATQRILLLG